MERTVALKREGWLLKRNPSGPIKLWKRRYFVLDGTVLKYFEKQSSLSRKDCKGYIQLQKYALHATASVARRLGKPNAFELAWDNDLHDLSQLLLAIPAAQLGAAAGSEGGHIECKGWAAVEYDPGETSLLDKMGNKEIKRHWCILLTGKASGPSESQKTLDTSPDEQPQPEDTDETVVNQDNEVSDQETALHGFFGRRYLVMYSTPDAGRADKVMRLVDGVYSTRKPKQARQGYPLKRTLRIDSCDRDARKAVVAWSGDDVRRIQKVSPHAIETCDVNTLIPCVALPLYFWSGARCTRWRGRVEKLECQFATV
eukprot:SAG31_NODE_3618_length_4063_cov_2.665237_5_plen_314_part_00